MSDIKKLKVRCERFFNNPRIFSLMDEQKSLVDKQDWSSEYLPQAEEYSKMLDGFDVELQEIDFKHENREKILTSVLDFIEELDDKRFEILDRLELRENNLAEMLEKNEKQISDILYEEVQAEKMRYLLGEFLI